MKPSNDEPLSGTTLGIRVISALDQVHIATVGELLKLTSVELCRRRGIGKVALKEIMLWLDREGLSMRKDDPSDGWEKSLLPTGTEIPKSQESTRKRLTRAERQRLVKVFTTGVALRVQLARIELEVQALQIDEILEIIRARQRELGFL